MRLSTRLRLALLAWLLLEAFVFAAIAKLIGGAGAILLTLLASLYGWALLKRAGASAMVKFRATVEGRLGVDNRPFLDETLRIIAAVGLMLPGFLSDVVGLVLAVPAARRLVAKRMGRSPGGAAGAQAIDLDPAEWRRSEQAYARPTRITRPDDT